MNFLNQHSLRPDFVAQNPSFYEIKASPENDRAQTQENRLDEHRLMYRRRDQLLDFDSLRFLTYSDVIADRCRRIRDVRKVRDSEDDHSS